VHRLEATLHGALPQRGPGPRRRGNALEVSKPEVLQFEEVAEKFARAVRDDERVRLGDPLEARREVWCLTDDAALLCFTRANQIADDDKPGCNSDTSLQGNARLERCHCGYQIKPCLHGSFGIVFVSLGITEIDEHAVAHVFCDKSAEAAHDFGDALLIGRNDVTEVFRVHARGKCRRADKVGEHHRDLAALGAVFGCRARR